MARNKILILGSTGFIGKHLIRRYQDLDLVFYSRNDDLVSQLEYHRPNVVINAAAEIYKSEFMFEANIGLVKTILDYVQRNPQTAFMQLGSSSEYGPYDKPTKETDLLNPQDFYAATKSSATYLCCQYAKKYNLDVVVVRPYSPYGPGDRTHRLFPKIYNAFYLSQPMKLVEGVHDFCYIDDFLDGIDLILGSKERSPGEIINLSLGKQYTNKEVLETFELVSGKKGLIDYDGTVFYTPKTWCADISHASKKYGYAPKFNLELGIRELVRRMSQ
jgi:nucleoside-diphosphate-sugar epimerase